MDADGDLVTGATGLDSEISKDGGTFVDCTNEATEIATASGVYFLDLTSTEMTADTVAIIVKTTSAGAKTTPIVLLPQEAGDLQVNVTYWNGTAVTTPDTAGSPKVTVTSGTGAGQISLSSGLVTLAGVTHTGATIPTVTTTTTATNVTTVNGLAANVITAASMAADAGAEIADAVWDEARSGHTTGGTFGEYVLADALRISGDATAADNAELFFDGTGYNAANSAVGTVAAVTTVNGLAAGVVTAAAIATGAIDADALASDAVTEIRSLVSGTSDSGSTTTMVDAARAEADTDYWKGCIILFTSGTISGQARLITGLGHDHLHTSHDTGRCYADLRDIAK
jgi:hypothetical protein